MYKNIRNDKIDIARTKLYVQCYSLFCITSITDYLLDPSAPSASSILVSAAQSSFSKLMDRLRVEMDNGSGESAKPIRYGEKGTLVRRLGHGLHKLNSRMLKAGMPATVPMKVGSLNVSMLRVFALSH